MKLLKNILLTLITAFSVNLSSQAMQQSYVAARERIEQDLRFTLSMSTHSLEGFLQMAAPLIIKPNPNLTIDEAAKIACNLLLDGTRPVSGKNAAFVILEKLVTGNHWKLIEPLFESISPNEYPRIEELSRTIVYARSKNLVYTTHALLNVRDKYFQRRSGR